jgi:hypothetical protein
MNLFMAGPAEAHEVAFLVASAFRKRHDVMNLFHWHVPSFKKAAFTERVLSYVSVTDLLPFVSIAPVCFVAAGEAFVVLFFTLPMLLAVLLTILTQVPTSWIAAGTFWFTWHRCRLLSDIKKTPEGIPFEALIISCLSILVIS